MITPTILTFRHAKAYRDVTDLVRFYEINDGKILVPYVFARDRIREETFNNSAVWLEAAKDMEDVVVRMMERLDPSEHQTLENWRLLPHSHFIHNNTKIVNYFAQHQIPTDPFELWFARFDQATFFGVRNLKP